MIGKKRVIMKNITPFTHENHPTNTKIRSTQEYNMETPKLENNTM